LAYECGTDEGEEEFVYVFDGKTWKKETAYKTPEVDETIIVKGTINK
jgi:hypothetical protein